jgi:hypothetical protein
LSQCKYVGDKRIVPSASEIGRQEAADRSLGDAHRILADGGPDIGRHPAEAGRAIARQAHEAGPCMLDRDFGEAWKTLAKQFQVILRNARRRSSDWRIEGQ